MMLETLAPFLDSFTILRINSLVGFGLLALFLLYFFSKEGRDERGRKVIATSALCAFVMLFLVANALGYFYGGSGWGIENSTRALNCAQFAYTFVLLTADIAILILRNRKNF